MKLKEILITAGISAILLAMLIGGAAIYAVNKTNSYSYGFNIRRQPALAPGAFIEHETSGVLNFATSEDSIGDLNTTGQPVSMFFDIGALAQAWIAQSDTDQPFLQFNQDVLLDRYTVFAGLQTADTVIIDIYDNAATSVKISGPDTVGVFVNGDTTITFTIKTSAASKLDRSASEKFSINLTEIGSVCSLSVYIEGHTYDVQ